MKFSTPCPLGLSLAIALILGACSTAPATPSAPPAPTRDQSILTLGDTEFRLSATSIGDEGLSLRAKPGYQIAVVSIQTDQASYQQIDEITKPLEVNLRNESGDMYRSAARGQGIFCPGEGQQQVCWAFPVPEDEKTLWLVLPDGTSMELDFEVQ